MVIPVCLDSYTPADDSCSQIQIGTYAIPGTFIVLTCSLDRIWRYKGVSGDSASQENRLEVLIVNDQDGNLSKLVVSIMSDKDSLLKASMKLTEQYDIKVQQPEELQKHQISVEQANFICEERIIKCVKIEREFIYPGGYMRRGQVLNYSQLKMFHYGNSVRMPTKKSLQNRLEEQQYHILHPAKLEYE